MRLYAVRANIALAVAAIIRSVCSYKLRVGGGAHLSYENFIREEMNNPV